MEQWELEGGQRVVRGRWEVGGVLGGGKLMGGGKVRHWGKFMGSGMGREVGAKVGEVLYSVIR